ncbi:DUF1624 domain-containing protein [Mucilaginibacter sp. JRF]|uniref:DUF1624 domain-containing protein n=1 Tax=Mucilaginibacter sp. JRF TaxID=2780088 RepID=UPI001882D626|nr:heparan-alpha-glucosaminide N-acetyltransferase domain-containing protein [Mucilaginibacter sp. JRF]MBE9585414.1 DUF1624 domain-containing protein [Mucilaginibacter sp. JRF]
MTDFVVKPKKRIDSIDITRGLIMVIMALDHTRDFFMPQQFDPTDLTRASTSLFLTRFITHFCAPTFVFLAGTSAFLFFSNGKTKGEAAKFLITRGLWLVFLEFTVIRFGWALNLNFDFVFVQVIWALGISMIALAGLIYLPRAAIAAIGLIMIFGHNALDGIKTDQMPAPWGTVWSFLHVQTIVQLTSYTKVFILYPLIPWIGVMAVGYVFGGLFKLDSAKRKPLLITIGLSSLALFVVLRLVNIYGDPNQWTDQGVWYRTILSFINVQKYPPSLDYLLITLGACNLLLAAFENAENGFTRIMVLFGRVPMFYYILHLYLLRLMAFIAYLIVKTANNGTPPKDGASLYFVYLMWALAIFILYFPCRWYMKYKMTHKQWWLSYL